MAPSIGTVIAGTESRIDKDRVVRSLGSVRYGCRTGIVRTLPSRESVQLGQYGS